MIEFGPNVFEVSISKGVFGSGYALVMNGSAVSLVQKGPHGGEGPHEHVRVDLGAGLKLDFDKSEFTSVSFEVPPMPPVHYFSFDLGKKPGKAMGYAAGHAAAPGKVTLEGPACAKILDAAAKHYGLGMHAPSGKPVFDEWGGFEAVASPKPKLGLQLLPPSGLPWTKAFELAGAMVKVAASENPATGNVEVKAQAKAHGPEYAAVMSVSKQVAVGAPEAADEDLEALVWKVAGEAKKGFPPKQHEWSWKPPSFHDLELAKAHEASTAFAAGFKQASAALEKVGKAASAADLALEKLMNESIVGTKMYANPIDAEVIAEFLGLPPLVVGSAADFEKVASAHGLTARVAPAYPEPGCVLVALYKFDGRPAEWEECAAVQKSIEKVSPVDALVSCVPLTPELAEELAELAELPSGKIIHPTVETSAWTAEASAWKPLPPIGMSHLEKLWEPEPVVGSAAESAPAGGTTPSYADATSAPSVVAPGKEFLKLAGVKIVESPSCPDAAQIVDAAKPGDGYLAKALFAIVSPLSMAKLKKS